MVIMDVIHQCSFGFILKDEAFIYVRERVAMHISYRVAVGLELLSSVYIMVLFCMLFNPG